MDPSGLKVSVAEAGSTYPLADWENAGVVEDIQQCEQCQ
jgi:hypothetical protein